MYALYRGASRSSDAEDATELAINWLLNGGSGNAADSSEWIAFASSVGLRWHATYPDPAAPGMRLRFDELATTLKEVLGDSNTPTCPAPRSAHRDSWLDTLHEKLPAGLGPRADPPSFITPETADALNMAHLLRSDSRADLPAAFEFLMHGGSNSRYSALSKRCPELVSGAGSWRQALFVGVCAVLRIVIALLAYLGRARARAASGEKEDPDHTPEAVSDEKVAPL